jgi:hypothetical protein
MTDRKPIPVTVEGGFRSGDVFSIRIHDAANRSLMLELSIGERTILDLLRNRSRGDEATGELTVIGKGLDAHGLVSEHGQLVVWLAGYDQQFLDVALAKIGAELPTEAGWGFDERWNMHRAERRPDADGYHYRVWARRLVSPAILADYPHDDLAKLPGVVRWEPGAHVQ